MENNVVTANSDVSASQSFDLVSPTINVGAGAGTATRDHTFEEFYFTSVSVVALVSIVGNLIVIIVMLSTERLRTPTNYFMISLAVSDLMIGVTYPLYNFGHIPGFVLTEAFSSWYPCTILLISGATPMSVSSYNLVGITVVRFLALRRPLTFRQELTARKMSLAAVAIWILAASVSTGIHFRKDEGTFYGMYRYDQFLTSWHISALMLVQVLLPLVVMFVLYAVIIVLYKRQGRTMSEAMASGSLPEARQRSLKSERKLVRVCSLLLIYFAVSWMPVMIMIYVELTCGGCVNKYARACIRILAFTNSAVNMFFYTAQHSEFRAAMKSLFCCCTSKFSISKSQSISLYSITQSSRVIKDGDFSQEHK